MMEALFQQLAERTGSRFKGFQSASGYWKLEAEPESLFNLLEVLQRDNAFWCDFLQAITAVHIPGTPEKIQLNYHLESLPKGWKVQICCFKELKESETTAEFPSVVALWEAADWHEREAAELFGLKFERHPDLRKLLLPADWEGYPLRKNYLAGESYHGLKIKYSKEV